ncbi:MAG: hypothetical protein IIC72_06860 [Acidobacteria bacterium]|nr:hypothetical protein [Acidobacteriota bacterium]
MRRRRMIMILAVMGMVMGVMAPASAGGPQCADFDGSGWVNHGTHITDGYVNDAETDPGNPTPPGVRGRAAHIGVDAPPGATFCGTHGSVDTSFRVPGNGPPTP